VSHTNESTADLKEQELEMREEQDEMQTVSSDADASVGEAETYKKLADENFQKLLRAQADFDNFRRRSRQEKEDFAKYASIKLIEQLLPVYDNLDRALVAGKESNEVESLIKGVEMIFRQFAGILETEGLQPIDAVGQPFNPEFHQAIMQVESEEHEEGIVVEEIQKGYMLKDKVIRPSMVKVSS